MPTTIPSARWTPFALTMLLGLALALAIAVAAGPGMAWLGFAMAAVYRETRGGRSCFARPRARRRA